MIPCGLVALGKWKIYSEKSFSGRGDGSWIPYYTDKYEHIKKMKQKKVNKIKILLFIQGQYRTNLNFFTQMKTTDKRLYFSMPQCWGKTIMHFSCYSKVSDENIVITEVSSSNWTVCIKGIKNDIFIFF